ncbi:MAG: hypothetical protein N3A66_02595 [Planctomycetota bacterium]|nr:hypothetical protein [Planctomycetota bacterium]
MSRLPRLIVYALLGIAAGCVDANVEVMVKKNGSGTIRETIFLLPAAVVAVNESLLPLRRQLWEEERRAATAAKKGEAKTTKDGKKGEEKLEEPEEEDLPEIDPIAIDEDLLRRRASLMGEGVTLVSAKRLSNKAGDLGREVIFAFSDITKVKLPLWLDNPAVIDLWRGAHSASHEYATFTIEKGVETKLLVTLPALIALSKEERLQRLLLQGVHEISEEKRKNIGDLLAGFRCRLCVQPEGKILRTNAGRVDKANVVLVEIEPAPLFAKTATAILAMECMKGVTLQRIYENLAGKPGIWIEPTRPVEIIF